MSRSYASFYLALSATALCVSCLQQPLGKTRNLSQISAPGDADPQQPIEHPVTVDKKKKTNSTSVNIPIADCRQKFDGFEIELIEAMNKAKNTDVGIQAHIAFNRLGYGASPHFRQTPQDFKDLEDIGQTKVAREELADLIVQQLKMANAKDSKDFKKRFGRMFPLGSLSYKDLVEKDAALKVEFPIQSEFITEKRKLRTEIRTTASAYAVARALSGKGPHIRALLSEFWFNHFNVDSTKAKFHSLDYERQLSYRVCGTFLDLLKTSATHPAMLVYLDNFKSTKDKDNGGGLNENYARELMELYTLGIGPKSPAETQSPYDQETVTKVAQLLTGWTFKKPEGEAPTFHFRKLGHDSSRSKIMGKKYNKGLEGGLELLKDLAAHPKTKQFVCTKLARELMGFDVTRGPIDRCISKWGNKGNLVAMYKSFLTESQFWSRANFNNTIKSPLDLVTSGARALGYTFKRVPDRGFINKLVSHSTNMGLHPRRVAPPTGYSMDDRTWINSNYQAAAINFAFTFGSDNLPLVLEDKNLNGLKKEKYIQSVDSVNAAVDMVLFQSLFSKPEGYFAQSGRDALKQAIETPDYDRINKTTLPVRTINSLVLGSSLFIQK